MIEIHYMVLVGASSFISGLGVIIWALRDALAQEEAASSKLANDCTQWRAISRDLQQEVDETNDGYDDLEKELAQRDGELRKSLDHVELAKLQRDEANDDFEALDEVATAANHALTRRLQASEQNLHYASKSRDMWMQLANDLTKAFADETELLKLERDEARDAADATWEALVNAEARTERLRSDVAPKRKRLAS